MRKESLDAALIGIDVIVNCAHSRIDAGPTVEGTRLLLDRGAAMGVRRLIHMSSVAVYGDALGIVTEETSPVPPVNLYGQQKWMAEQLCRSLRLPHGLLSLCCGQRSYMDPRASCGPPCTSNASWQVN